MVRKKKPRRRGGQDDRCDSFYRLAKVYNLSLLDRGDETWSFKKLAINSSRCSMMNERGCSYSCEPLGIYV